MTKLDQLMSRIKAEHPSRSPIEGEATQDIPVPNELSKERDPEFMARMASIQRSASHFGHEVDPNK